MARPRKNSKSKNRNGTGTVSTILQKVDRKENRKKEMCKICSQCTDRSICDNRVGTKKCSKCLACTDKNCDRFYIYTNITALSSRETGNRKYLGKFDTQKDAQNNIDRAKNGGFIEKSSATLFEVLENKNKDKLSANSINDNTDGRNENIRNKLRLFGIGDKKIQKVTTQDIQTFLNSLKDSYSQSEIDKQKDEINAGFKYAIAKGIVKENPCQNLISVVSSLPVKLARPFEIDEQNLLLDYINTHDNLTDIRSTMDSITFKNIVKLAFACGQRIGEILALQTGYDTKQYTSDINFEKDFFIISKTITRKKHKFILGNCTKNSKKRKRRGLPDERRIPFNVAPKNIISDIFKEQIEHAKTFDKNTKHFVFCNKNGEFINHSQVTTTFKRICRKLHIQDYDPDGCYIHQARHSFVTRCLESGMRVETIADLIGDNVEQVNETYGHILERFKNNELDKLHRYSTENNLKY